MRKVGCLYKNDFIERFYKSFKSDFVYLNKFQNIAYLDKAANKYVYVWYNYIRPHTYNGGLIPREALKFL